MNSKNRAILFFSFVALFFLAAPVLVFYSQGYRLNWPPQNRQKLIVMTGGLFIKASPKQANIYINGNLAKKTDFFFGSSLVENLLPRTYAVKIQKDGYQTWTKDLPVQEKQVTEVKHIILFGQTISAEILEKNVIDFWPSPDSREIAILQPSTRGWQLNLYDVNQNVKSQLVGESDLSKTGAAIKSLKWANDSFSLELAIATANQLKYFTINTQNPSSNPAAAAAPNSDSPTESLASATSGLTSYYIDQSGSVFKKEPLQAALKLNETLLPTGKDLIYKLWVYGQFVFARVGGDLYELAPKSNQFTKIFQDLASDVILSPDNGKIAYSSDSEIWVMHIKDKTDQPQKNAGDKVFIARLSKQIANLAWFDSDYLIFSTGSSIKAAEIDDRGAINIANLIDIPQAVSATSTTQSAFDWDPASKNLLMFNGDTLYKSQISTD